MVRGTSRFAGSLPAARAAIAAVALAVALVLAGCGISTAPQATGDSDVLKIYATTGQLADLVENVAPGAQVQTMVGPGGDPHTYQPSTRDFEAILGADLVIWNGLHLEAQIVDQLESLGDAQLAVGDGLPADLLLDLPETDAQGDALRDPHIWNSPEAWSLVVYNVAEKLAEIDPENASEYRANAEAYVAEIEAAAEEAERLLESIPQPRMLITGHDAFAYFGERYDLDVHATDFISTEAQLSPQEISELAHLIADNELPVIFQDNQVNPQAIRSLQEAVRALGWEVAIADDELYADSLGAEPGVDTYLGVFTHNARAVAEALGS